MPASTSTPKPVQRRQAKRDRRRREREYAPPIFDAPREGWLLLAGGGRERAILDPTTL